VKWPTTTVLTKEGDSTSFMLEMDLDGRMFVLYFKIPDRFAKDPALVANAMQQAWHKMQFMVEEMPRKTRYECNSWKPVMRTHEQSSQ
jgi:catalase (peroxidase I)